MCKLKPRHKPAPKKPPSLSLWLLLLFSPTLHGITDNCINKNTPSSSCCSGEITLDPNMTTIANSAFKDCDGLTGSLTIPNSVTSIGDSAFSRCYGLTGSLTIPNSVTSIGDSAFYSCSGLRSLTIPNSVTSIGDSAFYLCYGLTGSLTIPDSVTSIGNGAFYGCHLLTGSLTIPNSVTSIGDGAFYSCSGLTGSLIIPDSVTSIGDGAFSYCSGFTGSLTIPNSVTSIGDGAFSYCSGFTGSLTIPDSVTSIGTRAFDGCSGFASAVTFPNAVTTLGTDVFASNRCPWLTCCNNCTLSGAQMCLCDSSCNGVCEVSPTVSPTVLVKYGFGVIFGYSGILDLDRAILVSFYRDLETGSMSPLSMLVNSSLVSSPSDPPLSPDDMLIKWRPVTESAIGSWEDQTTIPRGRLLSWLVSLRRREVMGFVVEDPDSSSYLIYFTRISSARRLSPLESRSLSITGPGISISRNQTLSPSTIRRYLPGVSDQKLYLLDSGLATSLDYRRS